MDSFVGAGSWSKELFRVTLGAEAVTTLYPKNENSKK
jgi:hypothetical protein